MPTSGSEQESSLIQSDTNETQVQESSKIPNELLDQIFGEMPLEDRARLRCISQGRKHFIDKIGYLIHPVFIADPFLKPWSKPFEHACYPQQFDIRANPMFLLPYLGKPKTSPRTPPSDMEYTVKIKLGHRRSEWMQRRGEFITSPPITAVELQYGLPFYPFYATVSINKDDEGIRIDDLLDAVDTESAQLPQKLPNWNNLARVSVIFGLRKKDARS